MKLRVAIITEIISPYRLPVFNSLAKKESVEFQIVFLSETDPSLREWRIYRDEIRFVYDVLPNWRRRIGGYNCLVNWNVYKHLDRIAPDILICAGYSYIASWQAARWCGQHRVPLILWSESTPSDDRRKYRGTEFLKKKFLRNCRAFVVPGRCAFDYLVSLGVAEEEILIAPNAVDNEFFGRRALAVRMDAAHCRARYALPQRFFLYCGRLTKAKGVFDALDAYASLAADVRSEVSFVFAGNGPARSELEAAAKRICPGKVQFAGFVHREDLPAFYALADTLIFPTHSDPWGLVVNEAMACGLPIVTTSVAGCAADLVRNGRNGFVVEAGAIDQLSSAMDLLSRNDRMRRRFGACSEEHVSSYSPEACARGLAGVVEHLSGKLAYA